jgi:hypothetical protein
MDDKREEVSPLRMYPTRKLDSVFIDEVMAFIEERNLQRKTRKECMDFLAHQPEEWTDKTNGFE